MSELSLTFSEEEVGERVDVVVARRTNATRTLVQRALRGGAIRVSGRIERPSYRIASGDTVEGQLPEVELGPPAGEDIEVAVRYADERVLVVSKPPGLVTHPARGHAAGTLVNALVGLRVPLAGAGSSRPGIVHRLDKDTSGLLLVAKDDEAQAALVQALRAREVSRRYLALVGRRPPAASGTVEAPVGRHPTKRRLMAVVGGGRPAVTHYRVVAEGRACWLLEATLETGRTHQIRVHLAHLGSPILGDRTYGGLTNAARELGLSRPFLHAWRLEFPHPGDGARIAVDDPLPDDLAGALERAGIEIPHIS